MNFVFNSDSINNLILFVLALSTLVGILDFVGFLPRKFRQFLRVNRADDMLSVLQEMGVDVEKYRKNNEKYRYPATIEKEQIEVVTREEITKHKINANVTVGVHRLHN